MNVLDRIVQTDRFVMEPIPSSMRVLSERIGVTKRSLHLDDKVPTMATSSKDFKVGFFYGKPEVFEKAWLADFREGELVAHAACHDKTMNVIWGVIQPYRHHNVIWVMHEYGIPEEDRVHHQGFLTNRGRFVSREDALHLALIAQQVQLDHEGNKRTNPQYKLFSEDLW